MKTSTHLKKPFRTAKMSRALAEKSETISTHDADLLQTATQRLVAEFVSRSESGCSVRTPGKAEGEMRKGSYNLHKCVFYRT